MNAISPEALRNRLVDQIVSTKVAGLHDSRVEAAMRSVPRHEFLPDADLEEAYANQAVTIKSNPAEDSLPLSCASQPDVVFFMLVQLQLEQGNRVFEVGAGSGVNAAYMRHLVGAGGLVVTGDIDPEVTAYARKTLDATGNGDVVVITRDGTLGAEEYAPFDRVIATVGVWDVPAVLQGQLKVGGRLVVPLRWRGLTRSVAFTRTEECLRSDSVKMCGFLPMIGQDGERTAYADEKHTIRLYWDQDQPIICPSIDVFERGGTSVWTETSVGGSEPFDGIWLRLAAAESGTCRITVKPEAIESGLVQRPAIPSLSPAIVEGDSIAYLALERLPGVDGEPARFRLGAVGYGPAGQDLADRICTQVQVWGADRTAEPVISLYPTGTPDSAMPSGSVVDKPSGRLLVRY